MKTLTGSTNAEYHANRTHLSSSQLKLILKDPMEYYNTYIAGSGPVQEDKPAFVEGSFMHSLILEPHKILTEYAVFEGLRKSGNKFEEFKVANPGKTIISAPQVIRCQRLFTSYKEYTPALELIRGGKAEESMVAPIYGVPCKARADYIVPSSYIVDVKTTSMPTSIDMFRATVSQYDYDLSAALYKQIADVNYASPHDFYWLVLSKTDFRCAIYKASAATMNLGVTQVAKALTLYKQCTETGIWSTNPPRLLTSLEVEEV